MEATMASAESATSTATLNGPHRPTPTWLIELFAAIDALDVDGFLTFLSPECEFRFGNAPSIYGHETIRSVVSSFFAAIKGMTHSDIEAWVQPSATIASGTVTYVRHNGTELAVPFAVILKLDHKLIRQYLIYIDNSQLFQ